jgi:hypothetical protein
VAIVKNDKTANQLHTIEIDLGCLGEEVGNFRCSLQHAIATIEVYH